MKKETPQIKVAEIAYKDKVFSIEYFFRQGQKETIVLLHGLGGAKENYYEACKSDALSEHTLIFFDNPGTGNSTYFEDLLLNVDDLAAISSIFIRQLDISNFILCGTSMGGLTTLLYLKSTEQDNVKAYINIEGNLLPEDCMFSSKVVTYDYETFANHVFPKTVHDMKANGNAGYYIIANNLELNTNVKSYYNYSFQTVEYSATGDLLKQFIALKIPKIFIYGQENNSLSYIPELLKNNVNVKEISNSNHFVFYDNPKELYDIIGNFVNEQG
ncbi:alpha/beta fold hydrolase [Maribacter sp. IgM3_T14_3]|uniref:alpha/beta fold hydrolase n=1 Tax=Maribacter sp. IgM3_T14_3 TaxID=3415140 RepID=UPI003C6FA1CE